MSAVLFLFCWAVVAVCSIVLIVKAFLTNVLWGLAVLFLPFAQIVFIVMHWDRVKGTALTLFVAIFAAVLIGLSNVPVDSYPEQELDVELSEDKMSRPDVSGDSQPDTSWVPRNSRLQAPALQDEPGVNPPPPSIVTTLGASDTEDEPGRLETPRPSRDDPAVTKSPPTIVTTLGGPDAEDDPYLEMATQELLANIDELRNRKVRVVYDGGKSAEGYPERHGDQLEVIRRAHGGYFSVHVPIAEIQSMEVVR